MATYGGLRDYGVKGQIGLEPTPEEYVEKLVEVFREVRRVLRKDGTLWLNLGDCYARDGRKGDNSGYGKHAEWCGEALKIHKRTIPKGLKPKDMVGMPWRVAFALQADGWWLRSDIIWAKGTSGELRWGNPIPESVKDRPTRAHEYLFLFAKQSRYYYDNEAIRELPTSDGTGRNLCNRRSVWVVCPKPFKGSHFSTFPPDLIRPCILAGCPPGGIVLDPFFGSGTVGVVALQEGRHFIGIELNPEYCEMARERIRREAPMSPFVLIGGRGQ